MVAATLQIRISMIHPGHYNVRLPPPVSLAKVMTALL
jgi:hypothetical protein